MKENLFGGRWKKFIGENTWQQIAKANNKIIIFLFFCPFPFYAGAKLKFIFKCYI